MTFSPGSGNIGQARLSSDRSSEDVSSIGRSKRTLEVHADSRLQDDNFSKQSRAVARPWAHLVAGGYLIQIFHSSYCYEANIP